MRKRFTDEQIVALLREAEKGDKSIGELCRARGVSEVSFYRWRNRFGGRTAEEAGRVRSLEKENGTLKRLLAERELELDALKAVLAKKR